MLTEIPIFSLTPGLDSWTDLWASFGLVYGPIYGLIRGLVNGLKADIFIRTKPNQGIWSPLRNIKILLMILIFLKLIPLAAFSIGFKNEFLDLIFPFISLILLIATTYAGGLTCTKHLVLRLLLYRTHAIPWNYARFLNHCTDRLLLQRVGGRYRFIHKLVQ
ncbi:MAG: hypothetical protein HC812_19935, partial [Leptolyngbya sp. RL_3_1]|nr:hypothetical protein [Leptolyngbya sp. RL_3_1]